MEEARKRCTCVYVTRRSFFFFVLFCCFNHVTAFFPLFFSSIQLEKKPF